MPRVKLDFSFPLPYTTDIPVRISDLNYGGHVGNDSMLSIAHEARVRFLKSLGYRERDIEGRGITMADAVLVYRSEAFHGDVLRVDIGAGEFSRVGCDMCYQVSNKETGKEVARIKTGIVFLDPATRKPVEVPEAFRRRIEGLGSGSHP